MLILQQLICVRLIAATLEAVGNNNTVGLAAEIVAILQ